jgi:uncharacterized membrane protein
VPLPAARGAGADAAPAGSSFAAAGILFGLGLGGFFDGIVLHQRSAQLLLRLAPR